MSQTLEIRTTDLPAIAGGEKAKRTPYGSAQRYGDDELKELREALEQNTLFYAHGKKVSQLEAEFAAKVGAKFAVACNSGTSGLHAACIALGISPGDEVITSPITDMGTLAPILYQGAIPVFADLTPHGYTLDPVSVESRITPRTKAVIAVHLWGNACDLTALQTLCDRHGIALIEDCAQAFGASYLTPQPPFPGREGGPMHLTSSPRVPSGCEAETGTNAPHPQPPLRSGEGANALSDPQPHLRSGEGIGGEVAGSPTPYTLHPTPSPLRTVGTFGQIGCFSLNEFKHISCGDGGIVVTDDPDLARRLRLGTDKAYDRTPGVLDRQPAFLANNYRMTELQGAVALAQLRKLDDIVARRRAWCEGMTARLAGTAGIALPEPTPGCDPSWWFYLFRVTPELGADATTFAAALAAEGVRCGAHYIGTPVYAYPIFRDHSAYARGGHPYEARDYTKESCPVAEAILDTGVMLTVNEAFTETDADEIAHAVLRAAAWYRSGAGG